MNPTDISSLFTYIFEHNLISGPLTILASWVFTRYVTLRKGKDEHLYIFKEKSFNNVYLPLFRRLRFYKQNSISDKDIKHFYFTLYRTIQNNYEYCDPYLLNITTQLSAYVYKNISSKQLHIYYKKVYDHIFQKYFRLRKYLGYSKGDTLFYNMKCMPWLSKLTIILTYLSIALTFSMYMAALCMKSFTFLFKLSIIMSTIFLFCLFINIILIFLLLMYKLIKLIGISFSSFIKN